MNGFGSLLMMRYKDLPPYTRSKKSTRDSSFGRGKIKGLVKGKIKTGGKYVRGLTRAKFKKVKSKIRSIDKEVNSLEKGMAALMRRAEAGRIGEQTIIKMNKMYTKHNKLVKQTTDLEKKKNQLERVLPNYGRTPEKTYRKRSFGALGLKNKLKLAMQKRTIASRKIRAIVDKPLQFIGKRIKPIAPSVKENEQLKRWGEIYKRENKKVAEIKKEIQFRSRLIKRTYRGNRFSKKKTTTRRKTIARSRKNLPPPLRKVPTGSKRLKYILSLPAAERRKAITAGINSESRKRGVSRRKAAIAKKGRLNILRIYRRNSKIAECRKITMDMKWIDRTYLKTQGARTSKIC